LKYCYYHNDSDGKCSAAIVKQEYSDTNVVFIPIGNSSISDPNLSKIKDEEDEVIIVDLSFPKDVYEKIKNKTKNITWIDHHKSTIDNIAPIIDKDIHCIFKSSEGAACMLTWNCYKVGKPPQVVELISNYDEWKYKYGDKTMLFHIGSSMFDLNPESSVWELLLDTSQKSRRDSKMFIDNVCTMGHTVLKYQESKVYDFIFNCSFFINLQGFRFLAINTDNSNAALRKLNIQKFKIDADGVVLFYKQKVKWVVFLYTDKESVDVSSIAKNYGGGGHRSAAGFSTKKFPFWDE